MYEQPGGTCLHWGCIPTKAMLHAAEVLDTARHAAKFGVRIADAALDLPAMHAYKTATVQANARGVEFLLKKNKVTLVPGRGTLRTAREIAVQPSGGVVEARERADRPQPPGEGVRQVGAGVEQHTATRGPGSQLRV